MTLAAKKQTGEAGKEIAVNQDAGAVSAPNGRSARTASASLAAAPANHSALDALAGDHVTFSGAPAEAEPFTPLLASLRLRPPILLPDKSDNIRITPGPDELQALDALLQRLTRAYNAKDRE